MLRGGCCLCLNLWFMCTYCTDWGIWHAYRDFLFVEVPAYEILG